MEGCLVLVPDDWNVEINLIKEVYDETDWAEAEKLGAVCLSAGGTLLEKEFIPSYTTYWLSSMNIENNNGTDEVCTDYFVPDPYSDSSDCRTDRAFIVWFGK